jgi:hypothetical protein
MRLVLVLAGCLALAACSEPGAHFDTPGLALLPQFITGLPGPQPEFGTTGLAQTPTQPGYADFDNAAPDVPAQHADSLCTLGYQKLEATTIPGAPVPLTSWRVRCNAYRPTLF